VVELIRGSDTPIKNALGMPAEVWDNYVLQGMPEDPIQARRWLAERAAADDKKSEDLLMAINRAEASVIPASDIPNGPVKKLSAKDVAKQSIHLTVRVMILEARMALYEGNLEKCEHICAELIPAKGEA